MPVKGDVLYYCLDGKLKTAKYLSSIGGPDASFPTTYILEGEDGSKLSGKEEYYHPTPIGAYKEYIERCTKHMKEAEDRVDQLNKIIDLFKNEIFKTDKKIYDLPMKK